MSERHQQSPEDPYAPQFLPRSEWLDSFPEDEMDPLDARIMSDLDIQYQKEIVEKGSDEQILTKEQETDLIATVQAGKQAELSLLDPDLDPAEVANLEQISTTGKAARDTMVVANLRLAAWFVRHTMNFHRQAQEDKQHPPKRGAIFANLSHLAGGELDYGDRMQLASIGLMKAVEAHQPERGRFSTFAMYSMEQELSSALFEHQSPLNIPAGVISDLNIYNRIYDELHGTLGEPPTSTEIRQRLSSRGNKTLTEPADYEQLQHARQKISLEELSAVHNNHQLERIAEDGSREALELADLVPDISTKYSVSGEAMLGDLRDRLDDMLDQLSEREKGILVMRFGLDDGYPKSRQEISKVYQVKAERIRQIEAIALSKLRNPGRNEIDTKEIREFLPTETQHRGASGDFTVPDDVAADLGITKPRPLA